MKILTLESETTVSINMLEQLEKYVRGTKYNVSWYEIIEPRQDREGKWHYSILFETTPALETPISRE